MPYESASLPRRRGWNRQRPERPAGGQVLDHSVQHGLNTAVLECRTTENGECLTGDNQLTDTSLNLGDGQLALFEVPSP